MRVEGVKINPDKCTFGVKAGMLLGFLILVRGIEVNPDKIKAIQEMARSCNVWEVQKLTGRLTAFGHFL